MSGNPELPAETFRDLEAEIRFFFFFKAFALCPQGNSEQALQEEPSSTR